jgi:hypothetical protein
MERKWRNQRAVKSVICLLIPGMEKHSFILGQIGDLSLKKHPMTQRPLREYLLIVKPKTEKRIKHRIYAGSPSEAREMALELWPGANVLVTDGT